MLTPLTRFNSIPIVFDPNALEETSERLFPESRHRSARVRKKLINRHGGEFRKQPCIWQIGHGYSARIVAHSSFKGEIERQFRERMQEEMMDCYQFGKV